MENIEDISEPDPMSARPRHPEICLSATLPRPSLFGSGGCDPNRISLRSQIFETRALFKVGEDSGSYQDKEVHNSGKVYPIDLPSFSKIQISLCDYFENANTQYPAIHPGNTMSRIHEVLGYLRYSSSSLQIDVDSVAAPTVALLCIMTAISEVTGNNTLSSKVNDRAITYCNHARSILQAFEFLTPSLEVLRCHTLTTIFLLHMDFLDIALQSSAITSRLALLLNLHRRSPLSREGSDSYDQNLWWTIYILDRHVAYLGGTPCLIRDDEIDAPKPELDGHFEKFSNVTYINRASELSSQLGPIERSFHRNAAFLEILAHLGRLWARIWNDLVVNSAESDCQWQTTEILDAQLRVLQQRLPPVLTWRSPSNLSRDLEKDEKHAAQQQLVILMVSSYLSAFSMFPFHGLLILLNFSISTLCDYSFDEIPLQTAHA